MTVAILILGWIGNLHWVRIKRTLSNRRVGHAEILLQCDEGGEREIRVRVVTRGFDLREFRLNKFFQMARNCAIIQSGIDEAFGRRMCRTNGDVDSIHKQSQTI